MGVCGDSSASRARSLARSLSLILRTPLLEYLGLMGFWQRPLHVPTPDPPAGGFDVPFRAPWRRARLCRDGPGDGGMRVGRLRNWLRLGQLGGEEGLQRYV